MFCRFTVHEIFESKYSNVKLIYLFNTLLNRHRTHLLTGYLILDNVQPHRNEFHLEFGNSFHNTAITIHKGMCCGNMIRRFYLNSEIIYMK